MTYKIECHEEVDMIAEKLYHKIPPKRELESELNTADDESNVEENGLEVENTTNELSVLNLDQVDSTKPKQDNKSSRVKRATAFTRNNSDTIALSVKANRRSRLSLPSSLIRNTRSQMGYENIDNKNKSNIEQ